MIINLYDPETKREWSVWKGTSSPPPLKARVTKSVKRVMFIFFMDRRGMLLVHAVPEGQIVNTKYYSKLLKRKFISGLINNLIKQNTRLLHYKAVLYNADSIIKRSYITQTPL